MSISEVFKSTEREIDRMLLNNQEMLIKSIRKLERQIISQAARLLTIGRAGDIAAQRTLASAVKFHKAIIKEFELEYNKTVGEVVSGFREVEKIVMTEFQGLDIPLSFTAADKDMFDALQDACTDNFKYLGAYTLNKLAQATYDAVIVGESFSAFVDTLKKNTGEMSKYAELRAHDTLMGYYSRVRAKKSADADIDTFLYYGNIIETSRAFCIVRAGKVFKIDQIQEWDGWHWAGKKPGSTLINRGGYRCRHSWHPCLPEWVEDGKIEVQDWHKEQKNMPSSLIKEIKTEESRLEKQLSK